MYVIKNAFKCISRSKGRNMLIGVIVLVIAISACLGLSIRQAAESARAETLSGLSVTATISFDRQSAMSGFSPSGGMGGGAVDIFNERGVEVVVGASGMAKAAVEAWLKGELKSTGSVCNHHEHAHECH